MNDQHLTTLRRAVVTGIAAAATFIILLVFWALAQDHQPPTHKPGEALPTIEGLTVPEHADTLHTSERNPNAVRQNPDDPFIETVYFGGVHEPGDLFRVEVGRAQWIGTNYRQAQPSADYSQPTGLGEGYYMMNEAGELVRY